MHPCLSWKSSVPQFGFNFSETQVGTYFGLGTLRTTKWKLSSTEIFLMLALTMNTFKMTEIEVATLDEMNIVADVLGSAEFQQILVTNLIREPDIFLNIPLEILQGQTDAIIKNLFDKLNIPNQNVFINVAVSSSNESISRNLSELIVKLQNANHSLSVGLHLDDCVDIVNKLGTIGLDTSGFEILDSHIASRRLEMWNHIVCALPYRQPVFNSRHELQIFLETHIYMKTIPQVFFPNLNNVYVKMLPSKLPDARQVKELILLCGQMAEFSRGYKISYFLMPAFQPEGHPDKDVGWWNISDYSDLANVTVYRDIQSDYLGLEPRSPILSRMDMEKEQETVTAVSEENIFWFIFGVVAFILFIVSIAVLTVVVTKARRNSRLLSDEDVQEFIAGRRDSKHMQNSCHEYNSNLINTEYDHRHEISKDDIHFRHENILGTGNFGVVYRSSIKSESVAIKTPADGCDRQTYISMLREIKLLGYLGSHENVVGFIGAYTKEIQKGTLYIVMELCAGGSLLSHLRSLKSDVETVPKFSEIFSQLVQFTAQIASGMGYVASKSVIHGDLAARNILLNGSLVCKISDFGLSRKLYQYTTYTKQTREPLPWRWMSVESLKNLEFSTMSDVWSFGVTVWEIFTLGDVPYPGLSWTCDFASDLEKGLRLNKPARASQDIHEKISACWNIDPDQRPNFMELSSFFDGLQTFDDTAPITNPHPKYANVVPALTATGRSVN